MRRNGACKFVSRPINDKYSGSRIAWVIPGANIRTIRIPVLSAGMTWFEYWGHFTFERIRILASRVRTNTNIGFKGSNVPECSECSNVRILQHSMPTLGFVTVSKSSDFRTIRDSECGQKMSSVRNHQMVTKKRGKWWDRKG